MIRGFTLTVVCSHHQEKQNEEWIMIRGLTPTAAIIS